MENKLFDLIKEVTGMFFKYKINSQISSSTQRQNELIKTDSRVVFIGVKGEGNGEMLLNGYKLLVI